MWNLQRVVLAFVAALTVAPCLDAGVDLTFEPSDVNALAHPTLSGNTVGIGGGTPEDTVSSDPSDANDRLHQDDGPRGSFSYVTVFRFDSEGPAPGVDPFVRITDFPERHLLSEPAPSSGIGLYVKFTGESSSMEIAVAIREDPANTGDNEIYEATIWRTIGTSPEWQYLHWDFQADIVADPDQNWAIPIAFGDGVYDGGGPGDATAFEAVLLRPIPGQTVTDVDVVFRLDDIHTGPPHSPLDPVEALGFTLR